MPARSHLGIRCFARHLLLGAGLLWCAFSPFQIRSADSLVWNRRDARVNAQVETWNLTTLLGHVAASTGWEVYLEPDTNRKVSVRFENVPQGEALRLLLGDLNFALLPQDGAPSKLFIYRTSLQEATQLIPVAVEKPAPSAPVSKAIPNELLVTLKPNAKTTIEELARRLGAKVIGEADEFNTYRLQFEDEAQASKARELLGKESDVAGVDSNYLIRPPAQTERLQFSSPLPFNLRPKVSQDSSQVIVGLIDTAVQPLSPGMNEFLLPGLEVAGKAAPQHDLEPSHGTSMAETILRSLAANSKESGGSSVRVLPVDVYGANPDTTSFDVARGIYAAIESGATIINLSMGGEGENKLLANLIQQAHKDGVLFFGAAGNQPSTAPVYPAAYSDVVAVTAGDRRGNIASYANRGNFVDVLAPGMSVIQYGGQSYLITGTSAATAFVSGAAAGFRASGAPAPEVESMIRNSLSIMPPRGR